MKNINSYTVEMRKIISYMEDVLIKEFPNNVLTVEYLIISILDNPNTHAYMILDNCLMSQNIKELRNIYIEYLENKPQIPYTNQNDIPLDTDMEIIFDNAKMESKRASCRLIGSEHILLSMLSNDTNITKLQETFKNVGIDYNFLKNKCIEKNAPKLLSNRMPNNSNNIPFANMLMPLKSEINPKGTPNKNNYISQYTISITQQAKEGRIDELVGREEELSQVIRTMARRKKNNVILVGNGGCGKTAIVDGLALKIIHNKVPEFLLNKEIVRLNIVALVSGTHFRGMFEERINGLFDELKAAKNYILFIDDMQTVLKSGTKDKDTDLSSVINDILNENDVQVIGAITFKDYKNAIETNTSISRKLQKIVIEPSSVEESIDILMQSKEQYEKYHHVHYTDAAIKACVELANRYITSRSLPDSAFDVLDLSGANTCFVQTEPDNVVFAKHRMLEIDDERSECLNKGDFEYADKLTQEENTLKLLVADYNRSGEVTIVTVTENEIANTVSQMTKIPVSKLSSNEKKKIANIEDILKESVVGQDEAIDSVCKIIKRNKVGLNNKGKTLGNLLMLGPSGTGKTLIAKKLAEEIFGDEKSLIRIDMSEYSEKNSVAKLTGAAPGYIGYENGGQLTEAIKNKQYCVLLLDEIEKADKEVYNLFLQLFDEGHLTDSTGQAVNFKNVIVLMTSNIGAKKAADFGNGIGFNNDSDLNKKTITEKELKNKFTPEFLNRIDEIVYFNSLTNENLKNIVELELKKFAKQVNEIGYQVKWDENVVSILTEKAIKEKEYGARPILRLIQNEIESTLTDLLLENDYDKDYCFNISIEEDKICVA